MAETEGAQAAPRAPEVERHVAPAPMAGIAPAPLAGAFVQVDAERGALLATAAIGGGERFQAVEALEIAFDEGLSDDRFAAPG